jgi:hypothetical protein
MNFSFKTQQSVAPYRLWVAQGGGRYLMHGQKTPGFNNSAPVRSVRHAQEVAEAWREKAVPAPYLYPEWPAT